MIQPPRSLSLLAIGVALLAALAAAPATAAPTAPSASARAQAAAAADPGLTRAGRLVSLRFKDTPIAEVFDLLSRHENVNIVLGRGVTGTVSVNLYNTDPRNAISTIANAAGYVVEVRSGDYFIIDRKDSRIEAPGSVRVRSFKVQYSSTKPIAEILLKHLSPTGKLTALEERSTIVVEDRPEYLERIAAVLREVDVEPRQVLIEAKILEITLDKSESFGVDWQRIFSADRNNAVGTTGLAPRGISGLFFNLVNRNLDVYLSALSAKGRVHTLSTPKLLALENQEASAVIGDRIGYKVTTTINQVTTESIQFLETGVILRVTPSVDQQGRIMLKIHPEVSSASVTGGIPSKKSTEVTTQLLCNDGESIFIGGLIKNTLAKRRSGVPLLSDIPGLGAAFSHSEDNATMTETVVVITPRIVRNAAELQAEAKAEKFELTRSEVLRQVLDIERHLPWASEAPRAR